jgi:hypothetical protein
MFRPGDFQRAFRAVARSTGEEGGEVLLSEDSCPAFAWELFMGQYPPVAEERLRAKLAGRGAVDWETLWPLMDSLRGM